MTLVNTIDQRNINPCSAMTMHLQLHKSLIISTGWLIQAWRQNIYQWTGSTFGPNITWLCQAIISTIDDYLSAGLSRKTLVKSKYQTFPSKKIHLKMLSANSNHFVQASKCSMNFCFVWYPFLAFFTHPRRDTAPGGHAMYCIKELTC